MQEREEGGDFIEKKREREMKEIETDEKKGKEKW